MHVFLRAGRGHNLFYSLFCARAGGATFFASCFAKARAWVGGRELVAGGCRQADRQAGRKAGKQAGGQAGKQAGRQAGGQTGRQRNRATKGKQTTQRSKTAI